MTTTIVIARTRTLVRTIPITELGITIATIVATRIPAATIAGIIVTLEVLLQATIAVPEVPLVIAVALLEAPALLLLLVEEVVNSRHFVL